MQVVWIGIGGFVGANLRYWVQQWAAVVWGPAFPYGTLIANVSGGFLLAFFLTLSTEKIAVPTEARLFVAVGLLGGFTTFSSFCYETMYLVNQGRCFAAALNFLANTVLGMVGIIAGVALARWLQAIGG